MDKVCYIGAGRPPKRREAVIRAAPSWYEQSHPVGSAERFLDDAAKEALVMAAAGGAPTPRRLVAGAVKAVAKEAAKLPDGVLAEAAKLPKEELMKRAARAAAYQKAMKVQNRVVAATAAVNSPVGNLATTTAAADAVEALVAGRGGDAAPPEPDPAGVHQDVKGGDTPRGSEAVPESPDAVPESPEAAPGGPRIVINPRVFGDRRDALCVAFNEAFRLVMEENAFEPVSEPTERQRRFFADTAYADDELQLRRTILARIATLDTSVSDPTDEQLEETAEMLEMVMEVGAPQNEWEQQAVQRLHDVVAKAREGRARDGTPPSDADDLPLPPAR